MSLSVSNLQQPPLSPPISPSNPFTARRLLWSKRGGCWSQLFPFLKDRQPWVLLKCSSLFSELQLAIMSEQHWRQCWAVKCWLIPKEVFTWYLTRTFETEQNWTDPIEEHGRASKLWAWNGVTWSTENEEQVPPPRKLPKPVKWGEN